MAPIQVTDLACNSTFLPDLGAPNHYLEAVHNRHVERVVIQHGPAGANVRAEIARYPGILPDRASIMHLINSVWPGNDICHIWIVIDLGPAPTKASNYCCRARYPGVLPDRTIVLRLVQVAPGSNLSGNPDVADLPVLVVADLLPAGTKTARVAWRTGILPDKAVLPHLISRRFPSCHADGIWVAVNLHPARARPPIIISIVLIHAARGPREFPEGAVEVSLKQTGVA